MDSFYSVEELNNIGFKKLGENVKISRKTSIYGANNISIGSNVRIDDYCCLVAGKEGIVLGSYIHLAFFCILMGSSGIEMEDFSGLSSRVSIYSATDDYSGNSLTNPTVPDKYKKIYSGKVTLRKHVIIGTNTTILPNLEIGFGSSVGANSLVTKSLEEWGVYVGTPAKKIKERSRDLLKIEAGLISDLQGNL